VLETNSNTNLLLHDTCSHCGSPLDFKNIPKVLAHMSAHILHGPEITYPLPCGLCLSPAPMCEFFLVKGKGRNGSTIIDMRRSHCKNLRAKFRLSSASKFKRSSPSTNVPLQCPYCPSKSAAVWKFCLEHHMRKVHPDVDRKQYEHMWMIGDDERSLLQHVWNTRETSGMPKKSAKQKKDGELEISEAHSSRMALR
jgi:hypothetical protein